MKNTAVVILVLIVAFPLFGALAGRLAAPELARLNYIVRLATNVRQSDLHPAEEKPTRLMTPEEKDVKAFKTTGMPSALLYTQAAEVRHQFAVGSAWFGAWCGLIAALKIASLLKWRRRAEYDADPADCLACARCYKYCPVERERLEQALGERPL